MVVYNCVNDEDFLRKSEHGIGKRAIYYFYLDSCSTCERIKPLFDDLCKKYEDTSIVYTYPYYNDDQLTGEAFEVRQVPTFVVMDNGQEVTRHVGAEDDKVRELFEKYGQ
uniref:Thioredoxin domain-containing protein n=1 Tax=Caenorhabditis japonica TaxID=281687 RepID=A0A8R1I5N6_CAEJA